METESKGYDLTIEVNGFELSYDDVGKGEIPFIFLHGFPFSKKMWREQLEFLKSTNRAIACDIRGFGESTDEETSLSIDMFAEDLIKFMAKLEIERAILCGLSMGGFIALNAMKRFPDRFEALILCDTNCIADTEEIKQKRYNIIDEIAVAGVAAFNEGFIKSVFHPNSLTNKSEIVNDLRNVVFSNSRNIITMGLCALAERTETCSTLMEITIPTLIICGSDDQVTPLSQSEFLHDKIVGSELRIVDNAGHVSNLEQPDVFNQYILNFLTLTRGVDLEDILQDEDMEK